jgi:hypothetical protein
MAYEESLRNITLKADATVAVYTGVSGQPGSPAAHGGKQYRLVKVTGVGLCGVSDTTANEVIIGVLQNKPQYLNTAATVGISGVTLAEAGAAITAGAALKGDANGRVVTATLPADAALVVGVALSTVAASTHLVTMLLRVKG